MIRATEFRRPRRLTVGTLLSSIWSLAVLAGTLSASELERTSGTLGEGTIWGTPWFAVESDVDGPTVLVTGGVHGNEPAGSAAAEQILHWPIARGRLIVVPRVNRLGLEADMRWFPPTRNDRALRDLNRNFPTASDEAPQTPLAEAVWELVRDQGPDLVIDLHEGFDFHVANPKSVGSSVIHSPSEERNRLSQMMLGAVNQTVNDDERRFVQLAKSGAAQGSLVRACTDVLGINAFILETTFKDQPISRRTRQHRVMVSTLLQEVGLIDSDCADELAAGTHDARLKVAMFDDAGTTTRGKTNLTNALGATKFALVRVGPADMTPRVLRQFDVVLFPGGSGSKQGRAIGPDGREAVRQFVDTGGGVVGVCAGAYLCSAHYDWSLHVINTSVFNKTVEIPDVGRKSMWYRGGPTDVELEFSAAAKGILNRAGQVVVRYQNGPIIAPGPDRHLPEFTPLAWFRSEVAKYEPQRGTMVDTPAIVAAPFGQGRVVSISPHPEATPGLESVVADAVVWASGETTISSGSASAIED